MPNDHATAGFLMSASPPVSPEETTTAQMPGRYRWLTFLMGMFFLLALGLILFALFWGADKGFNLTDEGFYLLHYQHPERYPISMNALPFILNKLYRLCHGDLYGLRVSRIILLLSGTVFFTRNFLLFLRQWAEPFGPQNVMNTLLQQPRSQVVLVLFLLIGGLSACLLGPQTISYNHVTQFLLLMMTGLLLRLHARIGSDRPLTIDATFFWLGAIGGLQLLVKWPVSVLIIVIGIAAIFVERTRARLSFLRSLAAICLGFVALLGLYFISCQPAEQWLASFALTNRLIGQHGLHNPGTVLATYARELVEMIGYPFQHFGLEMLSLLACGLGCTLLKRPATPKPISNLLIGRVFKLVAYSGVVVSTYFLLSAIHRSTGLMNIRTGTHVFLSLVYLLGLFALMGDRRCEVADHQAGFKPPISLGWVMLLLLALPFVGLFGTGNPIGYNAYYGMTFWFALMALLSGIVLHRKGSASVPAICGVMSVLFVLAQVGYYFYDSNRYLYAAPLTFQQRALVQYPPLRNIQVDDGTLGLLDSLRASLEQAGYQKGDPIIPLYDMPGLTYLLEGESPGLAWYNSYPQALEEDCAGLNFAGASKLRRTYFLLNKEISPEIRACLHAQGVQFGVSHIPTAEASNIFAPFYNPGYYQGSIVIYAPRTTPRNP